MTNDTITKASNRNTSVSLVAASPGTVRVYGLGPKIDEIPLDPAAINRMTGIAPRTVGRIIASEPVRRNSVEELISRLRELGIDLDPECVLAPKVARDKQPEASPASASVVAMNGGDVVLPAKNVVNAICEIGETFTEELGKAARRFRNDRSDLHDLDLEPLAQIIEQASFLLQQMKSSHEAARRN